MRGLEPVGRLVELVQKIGEIDCPPALQVVLLVIGYEDKGKWLAGHFVTPVGDTIIYNKRAA